MKKEHLENKRLSANAERELLSMLESRFKNNMHRHPAVKWEEVRKRLELNPEKMWSINEMEMSGGEPDVIKSDKETGQYIFCDCAMESPKGRRSICYDRDALASRKEHKPGHSAVEMAIEMGVELLNEQQYRELQQIEDFDSKTSSWIKTPEKIRSLGGAIFCDRRYDHVFVYHNGAESYYASRGFRSQLKV